MSTITTKDGTQMALKPLTNKVMNTPNYTPAVTANRITYKTLSVVNGANLTVDGGTNA
jgi:hypothetical protein